MSGVWRVDRGDEPQDFFDSEASAERYASMLGPDAVVVPVEGFAEFDPLDGVDDEVASAIMLEVDPWDEGSSWEDAMMRFVDELGE